MKYQPKWLALGVFLLSLAACGGGGDGGGGGGGGGTIKPRFAYVANSADNTVSIYTVNATTGQLRHNGYVVTGAGPSSVTVDPLGKFAYVANTSDSNISAYTINASTGALTSVGPTVIAGVNPSSVIVDPSGKFVYVANTNGNSVTAYTIDATTGALNIGGTVGSGTQPISTTIDPSGKFAYVANNGGGVTAYTIDATTGALNQILCGGGAGCSGNNFAAGTNPYSLAVNLTGKFAYVVNRSSSDVSAYTINATTGALTQILCGGGAGCNVNNFAAGTNPSSVTIDPSGKYAYVANNGGGVSAYTINATTGALNQILCGGGAGCSGNNFAAGTNPSSVTIDPSGKFAYVVNSVSNDVSTYSVDATTGALTAAGNVRARAGSVAIAMTKGMAAVKYAPKFAYVTNFNDNNISAYTVNATSGKLTNTGTTTAAGTNPSLFTTDPAGRFAYVANYGSNDVSAYTINASSGALTQVLCGGGAGCNGNNFAAGNSAWSVAVDPSGRFAYVVNQGSGGSVSAYTIDASTGALTSIGAAVTAGGTPKGIAVDPSGRFAFVANGTSSNVSVYSIDATTGALTQVPSSPFATAANSNSVTVDPSGSYIYVANTGSASVSAYSINATSGLLSSIGAVTTAGTVPVNINASPAGKFVYAANDSTADISGYSTDVTTGALTSTGATTVVTGSHPQSVVVDPSGKFAYMTSRIDNRVSAFSINATTGVLSALGASLATGAEPYSIFITGTIQ